MKANRSVVKIIALGIIVLVGLIGIVYMKSTTTPRDIVSNVGTVSEVDGLQDQLTEFVSKDEIPEHLYDKVYVHQNRANFIEWAFNGHNKGKQTVTSVSSNTAILEDDNIEVTIEKVTDNTNYLDRDAYRIGDLQFIVQDHLNNMETEKPTSIKVVYPKDAEDGLILDYKLAYQK